MDALLAPPIAPAFTVVAVQDNLGESGSSTALSFKTGDTVQVLAWGEQGWWHGKILGSDIPGWFPSELVQPNVPAGVLATSDFTPPEGSTVGLAFTAGQIIEVLGWGEQGWWWGQISGTESPGWFPSELVQPYVPPEQFRPPKKEPEAPQPVEKAPQEVEETRKGAASWIKETLESLNLDPEATLAEAAAFAQSSQIVDPAPVGPQLPQGVAYPPVPRGLPPGCELPGLQIPSASSMFLAPPGPPPGPSPRRPRENPLRAMNTPAAFDAAARHITGVLESEKPTEDDYMQYMGFQKDGRMGRGARANHEVTQISCFFNYEQWCEQRNQAKREKALKEQNDRKRQRK